MSELKQIWEIAESVSSGNWGGVTALVLILMTLVGVTISKKKNWRKKVRTKSIERKGGERIDNETDNIEHESEHRKAETEVSKIMRGFDDA